RRRIADRRHAVHDATRLAPAPATLEWLRASTRRGSAGSPEHHARAVHTGVRLSRRDPRAVTHHLHGAVLLAGPHARVHAPQTADGRARRVLAASLRIHAAAVLRGYGHPGTVGVDGWPRLRLPRARLHAIHFPAGGVRVVSVLRDPSGLRRAGLRARDQHARAHDGGWRDRAGLPILPVHRD